MFDVKAVAEILHTLQAKRKALYRDDSPYYALAQEMVHNGHLECVERTKRKVNGAWHDYRGYKLTPSGTVFASYLQLV